MSASVGRRHCRSSFPTLTPTSAADVGRRRRHVGLSVGQLGRRRPTLADTQADVGGRRWCECRRTGKKNVGGRRRPGVRQCRPPTSAWLADVGRRHPPSCRSWSLLFHYSFFATFHYMLLFTSTQLHVTHLLSLPSIHSHPFTVDSYL